MLRAAGHCIFLPVAPWRILGSFQAATALRSRLCSFESRLSASNTSQPTHSGGGGAKVMFAGALSSHLLLLALFCALNE